MRILLLLLIISQAIVGMSQTKLSGKIKSSERFASKLYILKFNQISFQPPIVYDSILLDESGNFSYIFKNSNPQDLLYKIFIPLKSKGVSHTLADVSKNFFFFSTEGKGSTTITADADSLYYSVKIKESGINKRLLSYRDMQKPFYNLERRFTDSIRLEPEKEIEIKQKVMPIWMGLMEKSKSQVVKTLDTATSKSMILLGLSNLYEHNFGQLDSLTTVKYLNKVKDEDLLIVRNIKVLITKRILKRVGMVLPDITLSTTKKAKQQLHALKSDFILIDFWASWCSPCRYANKNELPHLYNKYQDKVKFIGITIDEDLKKWENAVNKDDTPWDQYVDLSYSLRKMLSTYSVPLYVILDKDHKVIFEAFSPYQIEPFLESKLEPSPK